MLSRDNKEILQEVLSDLEGIGKSFVLVVNEGKQPPDYDIDQCNVYGSKNQPEEVLDLLDDGNKAMKKLIKEKANSCRN